MIISSLNSLFMSVIVLFNSLILLQKAYVCCSPSLQDGSSQDQTTLASQDIGNDTVNDTSTQQNNTFKSIKKNNISMSKEQEDKRTFASNKEEAIKNIKQFTRDTNYNRDILKHLQRFKDFNNGENRECASIIINGLKKYNFEPKSNFFNRSICKEIIGDCLHFLDMLYNNPGLNVDSVINSVNKILKKTAQLEELESFLMALYDIKDNDLKRIDKENPENENVLVGEKNSEN